MFSVPCTFCPLHPPKASVSKADHQVTSNELSLIFYKGQKLNRSASFILSILKREAEAERSPVACLSLHCDKSRAVNLTGIFTRWQWDFVSFDRWMQLRVQYIAGARTLLSPLSLFFLSHKPCLMRP